MLSKDIANRNYFLKEGFSPSSLIDSFFKEASKDYFSPLKNGEFFPKVNIMETDKDYQLQAELPGMTEKDFEVSIEDGILELSGEKKEVHEEKGSHYSIQEMHSGKFQRHFHLPKGVNSKGIKAQFENGVLSLKIPKALSAKTKIQIN